MSTRWKSIEFEVHDLIKADFWDAYILSYIQSEYWDTQEWETLWIFNRRLICDTNNIGLAMTSGS